MAVTLKIDDKARAKPKRGTPQYGPEAEGFNAYALPGAYKNGQIALGSWIGIMAALCLPWWLWEATLPFAYGMPVWCLLASLGTLYGVPWYQARRLRGLGKAAVISTSNQAPLKMLLSKASKIFGIDEPEAFIEQLNSPRVRVLPKAVLVHKGALTGFDPNETSALVVRGLVDIRQGHARRLALLDTIDMTDTKVVLYLVWPVLIYAKLLRQLWLPHAQRNTDRIALFLVKSPPLLLSAVLKEHAAASANMQDLSISNTDINNWINQRGHIGGSGEEISTQYKLGRAIHEDPPFEERMQNMQNWGKSAEFTAALEKLKTSR